MKYIISIIFTLCAIFSFSTQAKRDGFICSSYGLLKLPSCPSVSAHENIIKQNAFIPTILDDCDNGHAACVGEMASAVGVNIYPYAIYDIDTNKVYKYQVTVWPELTNAAGTVVNQVGRVSVRNIRPTANELNFVKQLHIAKTNRQKLQDEMFYTRNNNAVYKGRESNTKTMKSSLLSCNTALNYVNDDEDCTGIFNSEIRMTVKENASVHAIISALDKASGLIHTVTGGRVETSWFSEMKSFDVVFKFDDGSLIVVRVEVSKGVTEILFDEDSSHLASGKTIRQHLASKNIVRGSRSITELNSMLSNPNTGPQTFIDCRPRGHLTDINMKFIESIEVVDSEGNIRIINIYQRQEIFIAVSDC